MFLTFSLIHFVNKDGEKGGGKLFGLLSADISRVNVWYSAGIPTFLRKLGSKEGKERKKSGFFNNYSVKSLFLCVFDEN